MLIGMNEVAKVFRERDPTRYFRITDVIIPERSGRPERPSEAQLPPERSTPQFDPPTERPRVNGPRIDVAPPLPAPDIEPRLERRVQPPEVQPEPEAQ